MTRLHSRVVIAALMTLALAACGSSPKKPVAEIAMTNEALQNAETAGALEFAPDELRRAREKQALAEQKIDAEQYAAARRYSEQATVDAELAKARAEANKSRQSLQEVQDSIQLMRIEIARSQAD